MSEQSNEYPIPVSPHVKKFLLKRYEHKGSHILVNEFTDLGKFIVLALIDRRKWKGANALTESAKLTETITLVLPEDILKLVVDASKLLRINIDMDRVFKSHLLVFIAANEQNGTPVRTACKKYLEYLNITQSEYSIDTAYKNYQRAIVKLRQSH